MAVVIEEWRPVYGYDYPVMASNLGRVKTFSAKGCGSPKWRVVKQTTKSGSRYLRVALRKDGKQRKPNVHRLVLRAFVGPCPERHECRHLDGNPENNRLDNLAWGTKAENAFDRAAHGTSGTFTCEEDVLIARYAAAGGASATEIAALLDCSVGSIRKAVSGASYTTVGGPLTTMQPKPCVKITDAQVVEIRYRCNVLGHTSSSVSKDYSTTTSYVDKIRNFVKRKSAGGARKCRAPGGLSGSYSV